MRSGADILFEQLQQQASKILQEPCIIGCQVAPSHSFMRHFARGLRVSGVTRVPSSVSRTAGKLLDVAVDRLNPNSLNSKLSVFMYAFVGSTRLGIYQLGWEGNLAFFPKYYLGTQVLLTPQKDIVLFEATHGLLTSKVNLQLVNSIQLKLDVPRGARKYLGQVITAIHKSA